jgi:outer membrane translocation and assembly module TamA
MKNWFGVLVLVAGVLAHAQNQSACPGPRRDAPVSTCGAVEGKGQITVHVATIDTGDGSLSGGYVPKGSRIGPEILADKAGNVERHQYRACDIGKEIVERVTDSFQRVGYFCVDVEPIDAQQIEKNEYRIAIHAHPGPQYRLKELTFSGATMFSTDELQSAFHMKPNSVFDIGSVRKGLEALQRA